MRDDLAKCEGKFDFCWPWLRDYTSHVLPTGTKPKGLGWHSMMDVNKNEKTRNIPVLVYGKKFSEQVSINFCPFCGADYKKLGRLS